MAQEWRRSNVGDGFDDYRSCESSSNKLYSVSSLPVSFSASSGGVCGGNYIEHTVSRFDTLAGVAIKYGVEVSDVKKLNGLVSDVQMFALKTLYIPLPGRHPPSPIVTDGSDDAQRSRSSEQTPPRRRHSDLFDSLQSLNLQSHDQNVSPAMHSLRGYYNLNSLNEKTDSEGCQMAVYQNGESHYLEDKPFGKPPTCTNPHLSVHRKCKSVASDFSLRNGVPSDDVSVPESKRYSNLARRGRQKSLADFSKYRAPEMLLKEDVGCNGFSVAAGKGLALRVKAAASRASGANGETPGQSSISTAAGDSLVQNSSGVKKSYSTPNFQDSVQSENSSSIWPTVNWGLKPDFQALSAATTIMPIFDGLSKPLTSRKNKTAVD